MQSFILFKNILKYMEELLNIKAFLLKSMYQVMYTTSECYI